MAIWHPARIIPRLADRGEYIASESTFYCVLRAAKQLGRPAVSNDNPYSESLFKTLKYRPDYPARAFETLLTARRWVDSFVRWYNHGHRHSATRFVTPHQRHVGQDGTAGQTRRCL